MMHILDEQLYLTQGCTFLELLASFYTPADLVPRQCFSKYFDQRVRIPVNVTADSGIVTDIPANVTAMNL